MNAVRCAGVLFGLLENSHKRLFAELLTVSGIVTCTFFQHLIDIIAYDIHKQLRPHACNKSSPNMRHLDSETAGGLNVVSIALQHHSFYNCRLWNWNWYC